MGVVAWYFVEDADGRMVRTPRARVDRFIDGTERLPSATGTHVRAAEVFVEVEGRAVKRVHRVIWPQWAITPDGLCDQGARAEYRSRALALVNEPDAGDTTLPLEVGGLRRNIVAEREWLPTAAQLAAVETDLNHQARSPPVVAVTAKQLIPE